MPSTVQTDNKLVSVQVNIVRVHEESKTELSPSSPELHLPPINPKYDEKKAKPAKQDIQLLCMACEDEIKVRDIKNHREFHRALHLFHYTMESKPNTVKQLVKRRRALMKKLNEPANFENPVSIKKLHKLNIAYELLKSDVEGNNTATREVEVASKQVEVRGYATNLSCALAFGICEDGNSVWRTSMEDRYFYQDFFGNDPQSGFFAVFDGYNGATAAETCAKHFHEVLADKIEDVYRPGLSREDVDLQISNAFKDTYEDVDRILLYGVDENSRNRWSGCSAVTCLLRGNKLYVANAGNVRAVLCKGDGSMVRVTQDHTPWNKRERHRVRKMGEVSKSEKTALVNGLVTSTRGLGNHGDPQLKSTVISQPHVECLPLEDTDQFVILASNGVWEVFSEEEVILLLEDIMPELDVKAVVRRMQNSSAMSKKDKQLHVEPPGSPDSATSSQLVHRDPIEPGKTTGSSEKRNSNTISTLSDTKLPELVGKKSKAQFSEGQMRTEDKARALAKALSERLVESAILAGTKDNVTVAVILLKGCPMQMFLLPSLS